MKPVLFFLFLLSHFSVVIFAQDIPSKDLKIGMVLSGGGAKGLAHIGVLKVIDEAGIQLDYIAGSSMGAIVGGLYASGYSGKQLDSIFHTVDFNKLIQDKLPRQSKTFYGRKDAEKYALTLPVVDGKIGLPKGISNGQNFYNFYSKVTTHVNHIKDFSKLPIPFFCTATNIETGKGVIFDKGHLPDVVAASGALPSVYSPVLYKKQLITDGGVTDNYPVEEIKKRGIDLVIGVDVQDTLMKRKELNSIASIMLQINNFRTIKAMESKKPLTDVFIRPDIKGFSLIDFDKGEAIIEKGQSEAKKQWETFKAIASKQKEHSQFNKKIKPIQKIEVDSVVVKNNNHYDATYMKRKMNLKTPSTVSLEELNSGLDNLYATKNFQNIRYNFKTSGEKNILNINVNESETKSYFRFGLHYDDLYKSAAIVNYTRKKVLFKNDVLSFDAILGDAPRYALDYHIDKGYYWSFGLSHYLYQYDRSIDFSFVRDRRNLPDIPVNFIDIDYLDISSQLYLETLIRQSLAFRVGFEHKFLFIETDTFGINENNVPGTVFDNINYFSVFSDIKFDRLNDRYFPSNGLFFESSFSAYPLASQSEGDFNEFAIAKSKFKYAQSLGNQFSFLGELSGGIRLGRSDGINSLDFFLGGFGSKLINNQIPFLGRDFFELSGDSFIKGVLTIDYRFFEKHHFNVTANYANVGNRIFNIEDWFRRVGFSGYGLGYGYQSVIGPIQIKYAFSTDADTTDQVFISVGYWF